MLFNRKRFPDLGDGVWKEKNCDSLPTQTYHKHFKFSIVIVILDMTYVLFSNLGVTLASFQSCEKWLIHSIIIFKKIIRKKDKFSM